MQISIQVGENATEVDNMINEDVRFGHYKVLHGQSAVVSVTRLNWCSVTRLNFLGQNINQV